jgi:hypothetical protein
MSARGRESPSGMLSSTAQLEDELTIGRWFVLLAWVLALARVGIFPLL